MAKSARLIYLRDECRNQEGVVIDTADLSDVKLEEEYGMRVEGRCILEPVMGSVNSMPTDRLLIPE